MNLSTTIQIVRLMKDGRCRTVDEIVSMVPITRKEAKDTIRMLARNGYMLKIKNPPKRVTSWKNNYAERGRQPLWRINPNLPAFL